MQYSFDYLENAKLYQDEVVELPTDSCFFSIEYGLDYKSGQSEKSTYTAIDLLSDLGGLHDILCIFIEFLVGPIAAQLWFLRAVKLLYIFKGEPLNMKDGEA